MLAKLLCPHIDKACPCFNNTKLKNGEEDGDTICSISGQYQVWHRRVSAIIAWLSHYKNNGKEVYNSHQTFVRQIQNRSGHTADVLQTLHLITLQSYIWKEQVNHLLLFSKVVQLEIVNMTWKEIKSFLNLGQIKPKACSILWELSCPVKRRGKLCVHDYMHRKYHMAASVWRTISSRALHQHHRKWKSQLNLSCLYSIFINCT